MTLANPQLIDTVRIEITAVKYLDTCTDQPRRHTFAQNWKKQHFVEDTRGTITLLSHEDDVLTSDGLLRLLDLHQRIGAVQYEGKNFSQACMRVPITNMGLTERNGRRRKRRRRMADDDDDQDYQEYPEYEDYFNFYGGGESEPVEEHDDDDGDDGDDRLGNLPKQVYCDIVETLKDKCGEYSLLEIWKYDKEVIASLSKQDITDAINTVNESPVFGYPTNYSNYLGQVKYNATGQVVGAKSVRSIWLGQFDPESISESTQLTGFQLEQVDPFTLGYEHAVLDAMKEWRKEIQEEDNGYALNMALSLSFGDEASAPIEYDIKRQITGYALMFIYTLVSLGKLNMVEHKFFLAGAGIMSVFFGVMVGVGLTLALGYPYTPITGILPFICLGIGIDDMFVIVRCFNNISDEEKKKNTLAKNIGLAMNHAGGSITVTSLTNVCAFATGASSFFPALQSFCISAAFAIAAIYLFQTTWFVAWMALDQIRVEQRRNGFIPFIVHKNWEPSAWSQKDIGAQVTTNFARLFELRIFQVLIILLTAALLSFGIWGAYEIKVEYDVAKLLPEGSYTKDFIKQKLIDFPSDGWGVNFYTEEISYTLEDFEKVDKMLTELDNLTRTHNEWVHYGKKLPSNLQTSWEAATGFWWLDFKKFIANHRAINDWREAIASGRFPMYLSDFLHHEDGMLYTNAFRFSKDLMCNMEAPPVTAVKLGTLKFRGLIGPTQHLPAQQAINEILVKANLSNVMFAYSDISPAWEVEEILVGEMCRNLSVALLGVLVIIFITLADSRACLFIMMCVIFTMVDVVGLCYTLDMTIDPFSTICYIIGVGLSVDYGAHIAHAFIISEGTKKERATKGFVSISPAIVHGGISTLLALAPTALSQSHIFISFFRIISSTAVFGLYHGLLFLPVMLALFGTDSKGKGKGKGKEGEINGNNSDADLTTRAATIESEKITKISRYGRDNPGFKQENPV